MTSEINASQLLAQMRAYAAAAQGDPQGAGDSQSQLNFSSALSQAIDRVNTAQQTSAEMKRAFETGEPGLDITQVMVASQKANIEFQFMLQVRNRLISAYQDIMNMQI